MGDSLKLKFDALKLITKETGLDLSGLTETGRVEPFKRQLSLEVKGSLFLSISETSRRGRSRMHEVDGWKGRSDLRSVVVIDCQ